MYKYIAGLEYLLLIHYICRYSNELIVQKIRLWFSAVCWTVNICWTNHPPALSFFFSSGDLSGAVLKDFKRRKPDEVVWIGPLIISKTWFVRKNNMLVYIYIHMHMIYTYVKIHLYLRDINILYMPYLYVTTSKRWNLYPFNVKPVFMIPVVLFGSLFGPIDQDPAIGYKCPKITTKNVAQIVVFWPFIFLFLSEKIGPNRRGVAEDQCHHFAGQGFRVARSAWWRKASRSEQRCWFQLCWEHLQDKKHPVWL